jgi:hypothetical protein
MTSVTKFLTGPEGVAPVSERAMIRPIALRIKKEEIVLEIITENSIRRE